jgi:hypothetical protein
MNFFYQSLRERLNFPIHDEIDVSEIDEDFILKLRSDFGLFDCSLSNSTTKYKNKVLKETSYSTFKNINRGYITDLLGQSWYNVLKYNKDHRKFYLLDLLEFVKSIKDGNHSIRHFDVSEEFSKTFISNSLAQLKELIKHETNMVKLTDVVYDLIHKMLILNYYLIFDDLKEMIHDEVGDYSKKEYENYRGAIEEMYFKDEIINYVKLLRKVKKSIFAMKQSFEKACYETNNERTLFDTSLLTFGLESKVKVCTDPLDYLATLFHYIAKDLSEVSFSHLIANSYLTKVNFKEVEEDSLVVLEFISIVYHQYISFMKLMKDEKDLEFKDFEFRYNTIYLRPNTFIFHDVRTYNGYLRTDMHNVMILTKDNTKKMKKAQKMLQCLKRDKREFVEKYTEEQVLKCMSIFDLRSQNETIISAIYAEFE